MMTGVLARNREQAIEYARIVRKKVATTAFPAAQKYAPGTRVMIIKDLGPSMRHFVSGCPASVLYTYAHAYGGDDVASYCLDVDGYGETSWYKESQIVPIDEYDPENDPEPPPEDKSSTWYAIAQVLSAALRKSIIDQSILEDKEMPSDKATN